MFFEACASQTARVLPSMAQNSEDGNAVDEGHHQRFCANSEETNGRTVLRWTFAGAKLVERVRIVEQTEITTTMTTKKKPMATDEEDETFQITALRFSVDPLRPLVAFGNEDDKDAIIVKKRGGGRAKILTLGRSGAMAELALDDETFEARIVELELRRVAANSSATTTAVPIHRQRCFRVELIGCQPAACDDVDECASGGTMAACDHRCHNAPPGSFRCSCRDGYDLWSADGQLGGNPVDG